MLEFIICPSCGSVIGDKILAFNALRKQLIEEEIVKQNITGIDINNLERVSHLNIYLEDIFNKLNIVNMCCRMRFTCYKEFINEF